MAHSDQMAGLFNSPHILTIMPLYR